MATRPDLPGPNDLPITEGPPEQVEPLGHTLSGPPPEDIPRDVALANQVDLRRLQVVRAMPIVTPEAVVAEMQKLLNIGESPPGSNCNQITARCHLGCCAWCDEDWWTALWNAGFNDGGHIQMPGVATDYWFGDAYVPNTMRHFQAAGRFSATPVPGAGEIHFWGGGEQNSHIAGFVQYYSGKGTHLNIEGNHNNVCEYVQRRDDDPTIMGYCIPVYSTGPPPPPPPPPRPKFPLDENQ